MKVLQTLRNYTLSQNTKSSGRLLSVDALRGFDMFWIAGGEGIFKSLDAVFHNHLTQFISIQLEHVEWLGFRFYDIIMPLFMFIVGVAMPFSFSKRLASGAHRSELMKHVIKRVFILWILGMCVQGNLLTYTFGEFHFFSNTLQAIAAGYLISSILILYTNALWQIVISIGFLLIYWAFMSWFPVPGGAGSYEPNHNAALFIDKWFLGTHQDGTPYAWIMASLNFAVTTLLGIFSGYILRSSATDKNKLIHLFILGLGCYLIAILWNPYHPIIKHLWTGSFVLYAGSFSIGLLAVFFLLIDVLKFKKWSLLFIIIGSNAIVAYMAWHLFDFRMISDVLIRGLGQYTGTAFEFIRSIGAFGVLFLMLWFLYRKKYFLKV